MAVNSALKNPPDAIEEKIITFPEGLIGLEDYRSFTLAGLPDQELFQVLQSLDDEFFGLIVTEPFWFAPEYSFELPDTYTAKLGKQEDVQVFVAITLADEPQDITANLLGPIVINRKIGVGFQVLAAEKEYSTRHKICPSGGSK